MSRQFAVTLTAMTSSHGFGSTWWSGDNGPEHAGGADENVEAPPAPVQRLAEPVDGGKIAQIAGHQRRRGLDVGAQRANLVVEFLQPALGARQRDDVAAGGGQGEGGGAADAARGAGDESDAGGFWRAVHAGLLRLTARLTAGAERLAGRGVRRHQEASQNKPLRPCGAANDFPRQGLLV